ncbi:hypothetical protein [Marinoscillum sp. MHG1-6]|uniref:hypothetical protein n=1 Tax=Marinoscillum sp. MHG1-6 TaxID=2959627 RepID=UPI0021577B85|nr:hypothetical protein [Marinoscillum sp. MHG1-6]
MEKKNKLLLTLIMVVVAINLGLFLVPKKGSSVSFDERMFVLPDTASVDQISFVGENEYSLTESNGRWLVNEDNPVDEGLMRLLMSIMQRVRVKRPVAEVSQEGVKVIFGNNDANSFVVSGNATRTKTYFTQGGKSYEVEIPGYRDYLASIFELHPDQWRDRLVLDESWRTIQELKLDYVEGDDRGFDIRFNDEFFVVENVSPIDSSGVVEYLNQFQYLQANERISVGRFPKYDTLAKATPLALLSIESINSLETMTYKIYEKLPGEGFHLVVGPDGEMLIFDQRRVSQILRKRDDFKLSE